MPTLFGLNLTLLRHDVVEYTEGVDNPVYYKARNRMQAYASFQLALVVGVARLLPRQSD